MIRLSPDQIMERYARACGTTVKDLSDHGMKIITYEVPETEPSFVRRLVQYPITEPGAPYREGFYGSFPCQECSAEDQTVTCTAADKTCSAEHLYALGPRCMAVRFRSRIK